MASGAVTRPIVVAIDGPAGSGKSSVSKDVARRLGYGYLDTGAAYRAVAWCVLESGIDPTDSVAVVDTLDDCVLTFIADPDNCEMAVGTTNVTQAIRETRVTEAVSAVASLSAVREFLNRAFRDAIRAEIRPGIVIEGRDITTVVAPDADARILLTADEQVRMRRRGRELGDPTPADLERQVRERDEADAKVSDFLEAAPGVETVDSTNLSFEQTVDAVLDIIRGRGDPEIDQQRARALRADLDQYDLTDEDLEVLGSVTEDPEEITYLPALPVLAVVGRPNVGKSALVNRILGRREAVVEDTPGVTRDRVSYRAEWNGRNFTLVDTGGWEPDAKGINASVAAQAEVAIDLADAVLFVVDANVGATATDEHVVRLLRKTDRPVYLAANKVDDARQEHLTADLWSLGLGEPYPVSALHGRGVADLLDLVVGKLPEVSAVAKQEVGGPRRVAILGRPNVGKSSLLNKAAGEERVVVNELAGTTRDPVDEQVEIAGKVWRFVDTAGIRRRVHLQQGADFYATLRTSAALEKAEVAVVILDVTEPLSEQDVRIIDLVLESGRALVLAFNKWDLLDDDRRRYLEREIEQDLAHVSWAPRVNISARTGRHLEKLVPALERALDSWDTRIPTGKFNAFLAELTAAHPHPVRGGKQPRILFGTQASTRPPTFVLFTTGFLDPGYRRFIVRRLREVFGFEGTPVNVNMRVREKRKR